jgi:hypothetical protein
MKSGSLSHIFLPIPHFSSSIVMNLWLSIHGAKTLSNLLLGSLKY